MKMIVAGSDGGELVLDAVEGWRVMEIIRAHGIPMEAECGGSGVCGTCQVGVCSSWADKVHEPRDDELDKLDEMFADEGVRLSCQLIFSEELNGLKVQVPVPLKPVGVAAK